MPEQATLDHWGRLALYFTMASAVLYGLVSLVAAIVDDAPDWLKTVDGVLFAMLIVGGVVMGLLYVARRLSTSRSPSAP